MDDLMLARMIGLGVLVLVFAVTVALMPRIFGVNPLPEAAPTDEKVTPAAAQPPAPPVAAAVPAPVERLAGR
jgi:hypothetical protein